MPWLLVLVGAFLFAPKALKAVEVIQQFDGITATSPFAGGSANNPSNAPPDTHGAAGTAGILASVNLGLAYYPKLGTTNRAPIWQVPLDTTLTAQGTNSFWSPNPGFPGGGTNRHGLSDAKIIFDPDAKRFFIVMQENCIAGSFLNLAVSRNDDPQSASTTDWYFYRWGVTEIWSIPSGPAVEVGIDYPGLLVDKRVLAVSFCAMELADNFGLGQEGKVFGSRVFVFDKSKLVAGISETPRKWSSMVDGSFPFDDVDSQTLMPAQPIAGSDPGNRIFFVELHLKFPYFNDAWSMRLHTFNDPLGEFNHQDEDMDVDRPDPAFPASQPGTNSPTLDLLDRRCMSAVHLNGKVWTLYTQGGDDGTAEVHWLAVQPRTAAAGGSVISEAGIFSTPNKSVFMPALGATPRGDLCAIYTQSGTNEVPTIYARVRNENDNFWQAPFVIKASANPAMATLSPGRSAARWGDYATVMPDPVDGSLWVAHEYVNSTLTGDWSTTWAQLAGCNWPNADMSADNNKLFSLCTAQTGVGVKVFDAYGDSIPAATVTNIWHHNGAIISDTNHYSFTVAPSPQLSSVTIQNPGFADEGWYDVLVRNQCNSNYQVQSGQAFLVASQQPTAATEDSGVQPPNRVNHRMTFVPFHSVVMFGGEVFIPNVGRVITNDFWQFIDAGWYPIATTNRPPPRSQHGMSWDSKRGQLVLFGGGYNDVATNIVYGDTWEWDGDNWQQRFPSNSPPARRLPTMAYDSARGETLLIGGDLSDPALLNQTWAWNGTNWFLRSTNIPYRTESTYLGPYTVASGSAMAFDERRGTMVLFGPFSSSGNRVWEWDGTFWRDIKPYPYSEISADSGVLDSRNGVAFYDPGKGMVGHVGGNATPQYVYYWTGNAGIGTSTPTFLGFNFSLDGQAAYFPSAAQAAFEYYARKLVIFGGGIFYAEAPTTRVIALQDSPIVLQNPADTSPLPGVNATLHAAVSGGGALSYQWYRNGQPVTNNAHRTGANTPTLTFQPAQVSDTGNYSLTVTNTCSSVASASARLGVGPTIQIVRLGNNNFRLSWNGTGSVAEEATDLNGPWVAHPEWTSPHDILVPPDPVRFFRVVMPDP